MNHYPTIKLLKGRESSTRRKHPWIFSGGIAFVPKTLSDGDLACVVSSSGEFLGTCHYHKSSIMCRLLAFENVSVDDVFFRERLKDALRYRKTQLFLPNEKTNCFRLIHGEGDFLPGLIIDIYNTTAVVQCHTLGMAKQLREIISGLVMTFDGKITTVYNKSKEVTNHYPKNGVIWGEGVTADVVLENGNRFKVNWEEGQKTGFFLDQRENRALLGSISHNKKVLNLFSYSGGFSIYALNQGALAVDSVDISETAIELLDENVELNGSFNNSRGFARNVKDYLTESGVELDYDIIIVDPPAFAKSQKKRHNAIQAYTRLNAQVFRKAKPGATILTFSCSQVVDYNLFKGAIMSAGIDVGRPVRIIKQLSQGGDHPVNLFHPEGHYLKGIMLEIL